MSTIKKRFEAITQLNPEMDTLACYHLCIIGQRYDRRTIRSNFKKLVDKRSYCPSDAKELHLPFFYILSNAGFDGTEIPGVKIPE